MKLGPSLIGAVVGAVVGVAAQLGLESTIGTEVSWFALVIGVLTGFGARAMAGEAIRRTNLIRAGMTALIALGAIAGGSYAASEMARKKSMQAIESAPVPPAVVLNSRTNEEETDNKAEADAGADPVDEEAASAAEESATEDNTTADDDDAESESDAGTEDATDESDEADDDTDESSNDAGGDEPGVENEKPTPKPLDFSSYENIDQREELPMSPWQFGVIAIGTLLAYEIARGGGKEHPPA